MPSPYCPCAWRVNCCVSEAKKEPTADNKSRRSFSKILPTPATSEQQKKDAIFLLFNAKPEVQQKFKESFAGKSEPSFKFLRNVVNELKPQQPQGMPNKHWIPLFPENCLTCQTRIYPLEQWRECNFDLTCSFEYCSIPNMLTSLRGWSQNDQRQIGKVLNRFVWL